MTARILDVTPTEYHRLPGFSASLAKILIAGCAAKAKDAHDRIMERIAEEDDSDDDEGVSDEKRKRLENGSIQHTLLLGKGKRIEVIPTELLATNGAISTKAAKAFCQTARDAGHIPVKAADKEMHDKVASAIRARLEAAGHVLDGTSELAITWQEPTPHGPVTCRCMMDHVVIWGVAQDGTQNDGAPGAIIYELKIVGDANPERCQRTADNLGYAIAAAAYQRALTSLYPVLGGRIRFQFLFVEARRPYLMWTPERLAGPFREIGERQWIRAVHAWGEGLATGRWPDYNTPEHVEITAPMWRLHAEGYAREEF